jgi:hypothetical protein
MTMFNRSTRLLLLMLGLVVFMAVSGTILAGLLSVDTGLFTEAMRIIGVSGPLSTAAQATIEAVTGRKAGQDEQPKNDGWKK